MLREKINHLLYSSKKNVLGAFKVISVSSAILAVGLIIYDHGFALPYNEERQILGILDVVFGVFVAHYLVRVLYHFNRAEFIRSTWFEATLMSIVAIIGTSQYIFDYNLFIHLSEMIDPAQTERIYDIFITISMLYLVGFEFVKISSFIGSLTLQPATTFIFSFLIIIFAGTGLLMMPEMIQHPEVFAQNGGLSPVSHESKFSIAFFTSVSASCVTGLVVENTATYFTFKGQMVILFLMQVGGIGIVSFATFFASFLKKGVGIKHQAIIQDFLSTESLFSAKGLLRQVVFITLLIEIIASTLLFFSWGHEHQFDGLFDKIFLSVFHGVSAFCNAGFSLFENGLYESTLQSSILMQVVIALTVIVGGIGFSTIQDVLSPKKLRERLEKPWKDWKLSSKIAIYTSLVLIALGAGVYLLTERNDSLAGMSPLQRMVTAFFQSVTTRTAGFNTVDIASLAVPTLIIMIFLMFIGASSGSTGGGIKTSTFIVLFKSSWATIRGQKEVNIGNRSISQELLYKAFTVFVFAASYNLLMIFILSISETHIVNQEQGVLKIVFEQVSAFSTVGLSTGITSDLTSFGKGIIILSMFVGRVGTLTLLLALSSTVDSNRYSYPKAHLMIG